MRCRRSIWRGVWAGLIVAVGVGLGLGQYLRLQAPLPPGPSEAAHHRATYDPIHFKPAIETATDAQCLACHGEVLADQVRERAPAGVRAESTLAWYQQSLSTYQGSQDTFHRRHLVTPLAQRLMDLRCNTCHQGHDPREEAPASSATATPQTEQGFTLRKQVNVETVCLRCHGTLNTEIMGLPGPWHETRDLFNDSCLTCHTGLRTQRHQVNYLKPEAIEQAGAESSDSCYGCHGGRAWYRTAFPYARHAWPGMPEITPDWAVGRSTQSEARFLPVPAAAKKAQP